MSRILTPDLVRRSCWQIPPGRTDLGTVRTLGACVVRTRTHAYVHVHLTCNFLQEPASWLSTVLAALCRELARWPVGRRHPHTRKSRREPVIALPYRTDPPRSCWSSAYAADHIERGVARRRCPRAWLPEGLCARGLWLRCWTCVLEAAASASKPSVVDHPAEIFLVERERRRSHRTRVCP